MAVLAVGCSLCVFAPLREMISSASDDAPPCNAGISKFLAKAQRSKGGLSQFSARNQSTSSVCCSATRANRNWPPPLSAASSTQLEEKIRLSPQLHFLRLAGKGITCNPQLHLPQPQPLEKTSRPPLPAICSNQRRKRKPLRSVLPGKKPQQAARRAKALGLIRVSFQIGKPVRRYGKPGSLGRLGNRDSELVTLARPPWWAV